MWPFTKTQKPEPVKKRSVRPNPFAGMAGRLANWKATSAGANVTLLGDLVQMRDRSRDLIRKNPLAQAPVDTLVANIIGDEVKAFSTVEDKNLRKAIDELWMKWCEQCDADGVLSFGSMQGLAVRCMIESGETFGRLRVRRSDSGLLVPLQIQLLEPDFVPVVDEKRENGRNTIVAGIERNSRGQRVAYHMYREHPGDALAFRDRLSNDTIRIPADQVIHLYEVKRIGQLRGSPWIASSGLRIRDLGAFDEAALTRKEVEALFAGFITRPDAGNVIGEEEDDEDNFIADVEPGTMQYLNVGEDVTFPNLSGAGTGYEEFTRRYERSIAMGFGATYERTTGDLSQENYSSIRAGDLEFQKKIGPRQKNFVHQFCKPIRRAWMDQVVLNQILPIDPLKYQLDPYQYYRTRWQAPGWKYVDPENEAKADALRLENGLTSRYHIAASRGEDIDEIDRQRQRDEEREKELGIWVDPMAEQAGPGRPPIGSKPKAKPKQTA